MPNVMIEGNKCSRCNKEWVSNKSNNEKPIVCPKCKSPYWDKPILWKKVEEDE